MLSLGQKLNKFLHDNNCHKEYHRAVKAEDQSYTQLLETYKNAHEYIISGSFYWAGSEEGHDYWWHLSIKWKNLARR